jgi:hypothetical protein
VKRRWLLVLLAAAVALAVVIIPALVIQPFRPQTPRGVSVSYALKAAAPWVTIAALLVIAFLAFKLWRQSRWWSRAVLVIVFLLATGTAWFARQNHFEWMFHPIAGAQYAAVDAATFLDDAAVVIAVERNGEAAAYPVRQLAYHHLVQDTVGGVPLVVTY